MTALAADRNTPRRGGEFLTIAAAAAKKFYAGAMVCLDGSGNATPGATATTLRGMGRCEEFADNSGGGAGAINVKVRRGVFRWANSASADLIAATEIGKACYVVDDNTVAKTSGSSTRSVAGIVLDVDAEGVWVWMGFTGTGF